MLNISIEEEITKGESLEKYLARQDNQLVLLRIYNDNYYKNRFLREGIVLRHLEHEDHIKAPRIIDEWPEYQIRAVEWFDFNKEISEKDIDQVQLWLSNQEINIPYTLQNDLISHLLDNSTIHVAYRDFYTDRIKEILNVIDWSQGTERLVHGDFHKDNIGKVDNTIIVYDWEYATIGSEYYDLAYIQQLNDYSQKKPIPDIWKSLVVGVITHWYLQEDNFSPKDAIHWIEKFSQVNID